jgi:transposase
MDTVALFVDIDSFCQNLPDAVGQRPLLPSPRRMRRRPGRMYLSEVMTIIVLFHQSGHRCFKHFYLFHVCCHLRREFPKLVSYHRFVELMPRAMLALGIYLQSRRGRCTGISFMDSTKLVVCHNLRIRSHRVMREVARRGKTATGWFYGLKLHLIVNDMGDLLAFWITPGNVDDRYPVEAMTKDIFGLLFADRGYVSQGLFEKLYHRAIKLITRLKRNMRNKLMNLPEKLLLRKRAIIETINDQLKNISQIEHTRHRSVMNYFVNLFGGLIAYSWKDKKPSLNISRTKLQQLPSIC